MTTISAHGRRRIGFLGPRATFAEQALHTLPESAEAELIPCAGSPAVLAALRAGTIDAGFVPIENTVEGAVPAVLDGLVDDPPLVIVREAVLAVEFDLMARPGTRVADVRRVASHSHGIAQTRGWITEHLPQAEVLLATSTAEAAAQVARGELDAAVASPLAAQQHGLEVLAADVADNAGAVTRFALLRHPGVLPAPTGDDRTTLAATTQNRPGSLLGLLTELAVRGIDLTRIESRPIKDRHAEYWFHLDCLGHVAEPAMGEALAALHRRCDRVRFLGSYPRAANGRPSVAPSSPVIGPSDADGFAAAQRWLQRLRAGGNRVRLILARHGRTEGNVIKALDSRPPGMPLDEVGRAQAEDLARRLAAEPVTAVYASCATRAQQTAAPIAAAHDQPVVVLDGVQEADCGDLDGATEPVAHERFQDVYEAWLNDEFDVRLPGGESALEVRARFVAAVEAVATSDTVVVVSHGAAIRLGVGALLGEGAETRYVPNVGIVILTGGPGRWELAHWDGAEPVAGDVTGGAEIGW